NVLGIDFQKVTFLSFSALGLMLLGSVILFLLGRIKLMQIAVKENKLIAVSCENELREFKRNAVEREVKLSRELQTERNKLIELKESLKIKKLL
ncbi:MAG TPA: hypothetical protein DGG95_07205, partial [Cytophagales bacterium]|nr:hypothetical protein [Cytophagales bacterium]